MARKTNGNGVTNRSKKAGASIQPADVRVAAEPGKNVQVAAEPGKDVRKTRKPANLVPVNLEEEIRHRAYELYQQRQATGGGENGDENQDWLMAEREIRARYGKLARKQTA